MNPEAKGSAQIYDKDLVLIKDFMQRRKIQYVRDALRICIEYANAHGALK